MYVCMCVFIQLFTKRNTTRAKALFILKSKNNLSVCWIPRRARAGYANLTSDPVHLVIPYHYIYIHYIHTHVLTYIVIIKLPECGQLSRNKFLEFDGIICNLQKLFIKTLLSDLKKLRNIKTKNKKNYLLKFR